MAHSSADPGIASRKRINSDAASESIRSDSAALAFIAASAAAPNATAPSRFGVPARMPLSCGPPKTMGAIRAESRTNKAPIPAGAPSL